MLVQTEYNIVNRICIHFIFLYDIIRTVEVTGEGVENLINDHLSQRLKMVASYVPEDSIVADIGTDHAYLPIYLVENNHVSRVIGSEVAKGPYQNAMRNVRDAKMDGLIDLRFGDGVQTLSEDDAIDVVTICGMGGKTIARILSAGHARHILPVPRLILQPNTDEWAVRLWLAQHCYEIKYETIMEEGKGIYEIIVADYVDSSPDYTRLDIRFGPFLRDKKSPLFIEKYKQEGNNLERILQHVPVDTPRHRYLMEHLNELKEVL